MVTSGFWCPAITHITNAIRIPRHPRHYPPPHHFLLDQDKYIWPTVSCQPLSHWSVRSGKWGFSKICLVLPRMRIQWPPLPPGPAQAVKIIYSLVSNNLLSVINMKSFSFLGSRSAAWPIKHANSSRCANLALLLGSQGFGCDHHLAEVEHRLYVQNYAHSKGHVQR